MLYNLLMLYTAHLVIPEEFIIGELTNMNQYIYMYSICTVHCGWSQLLMIKSIACGKSSATCDGEASACFSSPGRYLPVFTRMPAKPAFIAPHTSSRTSWERGIYWDSVLNSFITESWYYIAILIL